MFCIARKSLFDIGDGLTQFYVLFIYTGRYIREIFGNIFVRHVFEIPMWDMSIGFGSDAVVINGWPNDPFDPLYLISALIPASLSEAAFNIVLILKMYLAGVFYILWARNKGHIGSGVVAGALVYVFSGAAMVFVREPSFLNMYSFFPLLLLGADRLWKEGRYKLYTLTVAYCTLVSYYFTYKMGMLLIGYCVIRFFCEEGRSVKKLMKLLTRFVPFTVAGILIGIGPAIPSIYNLSGLNRLASDRKIAPVDIGILWKTLIHCFSCDAPLGDTFIGISAMAVVALICIFTAKKEAKILKISLAILVVSLALPPLQSVMNGFNYGAIRYFFAVVLCASYAVTICYEDLKDFKGKPFIYALIASAVILVLFIVFSDTLAVLSAVSLLTAVILTGGVNTYFKKKDDRLYTAVILITCLISTGSCFYVLEKDVLTDLGTAYSSLAECEEVKLAAGVQDNASRIDIVNDDYAETMRNSTMLADVWSFNFYHTNADQYIEDYYNYLGIISSPSAHNQTGVRARTYLEITNGVSSVVRSEEAGAVGAPYSYKKVIAGDGYGVYSIPSGSSMVFFYDDVISSDVFASHDPVQRETDLMYAMVVDEAEGVSSGYSEDHTAREFDITYEGDINTDGDSILVGPSGGDMYLDVDTISDPQISICFSGYYGTPPVYRLDVDLMSSEEAVFTEHMAGYSRDNIYYSGRDTAVSCFDSVDRDIDRIRVHFAYAGEYSFDDIKVYTRSREQLEAAYEAFYSHADINDISYSIDGNRISISASCDKDRYLYIAVPYSEGWHATVDGKEVPVMKANVAFMALPVTSGEHSIELSYVTPKLSPGLALTAVSSAAFTVFCVIDSRKKKSSKA